MCGAGREFARMWWTVCDPTNDETGAVATASYQTASKEASETQELLDNETRYSIVSWDVKSYQRAYVELNNKACERQ